jgi:hypothetical protein
MNKAIVAVSFIFFFSMTQAFAQGNSSNANGQPFQSLQDQINNLQAQVNALQLGSSNAPINLAVDCSIGETINGAINSLGGAVNQLTIEITGECVEEVYLRRSNVHLQGVSSDAGITGNIALIALDGASNISADSLTLDGGTAAIGCLDSASMLATNMVLENSYYGVMALYGGACDIRDSIVQNNSLGMLISSNGVVDAKGVTVQYNSGPAANVSTGGSLTFNSSDAGPSRVNNNTYGVSVFSNGSLRPNNVVIEDNLSHGINLFSAGAMFTNGGLIIRNNAGHGIIVQPLTTAYFAGSVNINNNDFWGLVCTGVHSVAELDNVSAAGNLSGDIMGGCAF